MYVQQLPSCPAFRSLRGAAAQNYPAWQVVEVCQVCKHKGWVLPTVYQGVYNALNRTAEYELVPVLRNYGSPHRFPAPLLGRF